MRNGGRATVPRLPMECSTQDCGNKAFSRGLCRKHYDQLRAQEKRMSDETEAQESELREENRDHVVEESPAHAGAADVIYRHNSIDEESGALVSQEMTGDGKVVMCIDENVHLGDGQKITRGQTAMVPEDLAEILIESGICDEPEVAAKTIKSLERREARKG